jgi:hypothetical protein
VKGLKYLSRLIVEQPSHRLSQPDQTTTSQLGVFSPHFGRQNISQGLIPDYLFSLLEIQLAVQDITWVVYCVFRFGVFTVRGT